MEIIEADFKTTFGFEHDCHCAEDEKDGHLVIVTHCRNEMADKAMDACENLNTQMYKLKRDIAALLIQLRENGVEPIALL